jgi:hypothetical protein
MINFDEAATQLRNAAESGDTEALAAIGWNLLGACGVLASNLETLRAACHAVPDSAWPACQVPAALQAA